MTSEAGSIARNAGSFHWKELGGALRIGLKDVACSFMSHIRPLWGLGFSAKSRYPPSPDGDTPFHHYVVPPPPSAGVGKFMEEKKLRHYIPCPPLFKGWVASTASRKGLAGGGI
jgi:hypothetical protein